MAKICVHGFVSGKVQGVWFRQSTKEQALQQGVTGWAKNLDDGRVEVLLCGAAQAVEKVQQWLYEGPELANVTDVDLKTCEYEVLSGFETG